jgi:hypothetical protein
MTPPGAVLACGWYPQSSRFREGEMVLDKEVADVWVYDVPSTDRPAVHDALIEQALPELKKWLDSLPNRGDGWRLLKHRLLWTWQAGALAVTDDT